MTDDLNLLKIAVDDGPPQALFDHTRDFARAGLPIRVYFKDLDDAICRLISDHESAHGENAVVVGCIAWLTNREILRALGRVACSIIVQKEDLWRPDRGHSSKSKERIAQLYASLRPRLERPEFPDLVGSLSCCTDPTIQPIRCVGNLNTDRKQAHPRSHHKFLVFGVRIPSSRPGITYGSVKPLAVWTGSFNFTSNAAASFENAVHINHPGVAAAYLMEWQQIFALSEPLDWNSEWSAPEYRIGT